MMDGRRHSIDVPISKTLVALRRVRSLRDPSTNSMSKLSSLIDNARWENGSSNEISLRFSGASRLCDSDDIGILRSKNLDYKGHDVDDFDLNSKLKPRGMSCRKMQHDDELNFNDLNHDGVSGNKSSSESCCSNLRGKGLDLACIMPPTNHFKDDYESSQLGRIEHNKSTGRSLRKKQAKPSELMSDIASHEGGPSLSVGDALSLHSASTNMAQDVDLIDNNHHGCGISCCWSKSPRFRELGPCSSIDGRPLISLQIDETSLYGHRSMRHEGEFSPILETPRSLSMKFRPKSFSDLVGQNVVTRSLLCAISTGRITSFYLFHGPRGTGKTSASRIFSAALNCLSAEEQRPCGLCRECVLFFSGRSKDVREVDSMRLNHTDKVKSLLKSASIPPVSSRFKVYVIDECQLLHGDTWASLLNSLENFSHHVVFVMITPDLDKLPRSAVSRAQRYHFPKIKDADIARRLQKICVEEGLDYEQVALNFIAAKSCGSLRDAEMMLDQLSLLGKKITISLAYELTGVISDDELLDLLDLALSSDTSNTVIRARELMRSRIDPLQLISQLANLIMDILAGKCEDGISEVRRRFSSRHNSEADLNKLRHALRILSETEKQLRISKNQTTWFTVALLQLSSAESSAGDPNETQLCLRDTCNGDAGFCSTSSTGDSLKRPCDDKSYKLGAQEDHKGTLDSIWYKATELCQSNGLQTFLRKRGKLTSLCVNQGLAVAQLEFYHRNYVSRAEKSWKLIASSLQLILRCNIELRINLVHCKYDPKYAKLKRPFFNFFGCSHRIQRKSFSSNEQGSESDCADYSSQNPMMKNRTSCSSDCGSQVPPHECYCGRELVTSLRDGQGNVLCSRKGLLNASCQESPRTSSSGVDTSKEEAHNYARVVSSSVDSDNPSNCFPGAFWLHKKKLSSLDLSQLVFESRQEKNIVLSIPHCSCGKTYSHASETHDFSRNCTKACRDENGKVDSELLCWRNPTFPSTKTWQPRIQQKKSHMVGWVLCCASAK